MAVVIDFETRPIEPLRPAYPPVPVGVAIKRDAQAPEYFGPGDMERELRRVWESGEPLVFHHAAFDLAVATERCGLPMPGADRIHDTMILAFLNNPYEPRLDLKSLATSHLGMPNEDVSDLHNWVLAHAREIEAEYGGKVTKKSVGRYICAVPEAMRKRYALADAERTYGLWQVFSKRVESAGMWPAYERERALIPILLDSSRLGLRVDLLGLERACADYGRALETVDDYLRGRLGKPELNLDANDDVIEALLSAGLLRPDTLKRTASGRFKADREALHPSHLSDAELAQALGYRSRLATCLTTFLRPWCAQALLWKGRISTQWHQVRNPEGGIRTGRIGSSDHNVLNLPKSFDGRDDGYQHPSFLAVPELPLCRKFILPDEGHVFLHRDFDGQELRVFAHFENGDLLAQYRANPGLDVHTYVKNVCERLAGRPLDRTKVKILNFTALYGGGLTAIASRLRVSPAEAAEFRRLHNNALPGRVILNEEIVRIVRRGGKIRTLGGRLYGMPPSSDGDDKSYVLLNYLVQGSSADLTKQALLDWHESRLSSDTRLLTTVYDEINISAPLDVADAEMQVLRQAMERPRLQTPMLTKGKRGPSWGELTECP